MIVVEHDPAWADQFEELREVFATGLGEVAVRIEHVGSTSVPGLAAKPVLDIDIVIESQSMLPEAIRLLADLGYRHRGDLDVPGREAFGPGDGTRPEVHPPRSWPRHHLYVCARDGVELRRHLAFRDWLRTHDADALAYAALKRGLALRFPNDIDAYSDAKSDLVESVLVRAMESGWDPRLIS